MYISPFLSIAIGKESATISFLFYKCSEAQKCLATNNTKRATDNILMDINKSVKSPEMFSFYLFFSFHFSL